MLVGCTTSDPEPGNSTIEWTDRDHRAEQVVMAIINGDYSAVTSGFDEDMSKALTAQGLENAWKSTIRQAGEFVSILSTQTVDDDQYDIREVTSQHTYQGVRTRVVFTRDNKVTGLFFSFVSNPVAQTPVVMDGFTSTPVVVSEGTDFPLNGLLSMPDGVTGRVPAIVLVHGSGPQDMNESMYGINVFTDIAESLASHGIAVLRYDKRSFTYPEKMSSTYGDALTVEEEVIQDAIAAKDLLMRDERVDPDRIFVLGHSLGGMLAPRIVSEGGFAGGVIMAGSLRSLVDIIYDQNLYVISLGNYSNEERNSLLDQVEQARDRDFDMPKAYLDDMDAHPAQSYLTTSDKPFLVMQGSKDFQVLVGVDFAGYEEIAQTRPTIETRLYDGLTHLFTQSTMEQPTDADYVSGDHVQEAPLTDIATWVNAH